MSVSARLAIVGASVLLALLLATAAAESAMLVARLLGDHPVVLRGVSLVILPLIGLVQLRKRRNRAEE